MDRRKRRKLLAASLGVAAVSYVVGSACDNTMTSGNLPAPPPDDASLRDTAVDQGTVTSGNLPAPPPMDAGTDADASDGSDGDAAADASDAG